MGCLNNASYQQCVISSILYFQCTDLIIFNQVYINTLDLIFIRPSRVLRLCIFHLIYILRIYILFCDLMEFLEKVKLAKDPSVSEEVLRELSKDTWYIKSLVAINPNTPLDILKNFIHENDKRIRRKLLDRNDLPESLYDEWFDIEKNKTIKNKIYPKISAKKKSISSL